MRNLLISWEEKQNRILSNLKANPGDAFYSILGVRNNNCGIPYEQGSIINADLKKFNRRKKAFEAGNKYIIFHNVFLKKMLHKEGIAFMALKNINDYKVTHFQVSETFKRFVENKDYANQVPHLAAEKEVPHVIKGKLLFWYIWFILFLCISILYFSFGHNLMPKVIFSAISFISLISIVSILWKRNNQRKLVKQNVQEMNGHDLLNDYNRKLEFFSYKEDKSLEQLHSVSQDQLLRVNCIFNDFHGLGDEQVQKNNKVVIKRAAALATMHKGRLFYFLCNASKSTMLDISRKEVAFEFFIAEIGVQIGNCILFFKDWIPNAVNASSEITRVYPSGYVDMTEIKAFVA